MKMKYKGVWIMPEVHEKLKNLKEEFSNAKRRVVSLSEVIDELVMFYITERNKKSVVQEHKDG